MGNILKYFKSYHFWIVAVFFIFIFFQTLEFLTESKYAFGLDGYYYVVQVRSYIENGKFLIPDFSLVFYFFVFLSKFGNDIVFTNKLGISLILSFIAVPSYLLGKKISNRTGGIFLSVFIISNTLIFYFAIEYLKNLLGIMFMLFFLNEYFSILKNKMHSFIAIKLFLFASFSLLSHKLTGALCIFLLFVLFLYYFRKISFLFKIIGFILIFFIFLIVYQNLIFHFLDLDRFNNFDLEHLQISARSYWREIQPCSTFYSVEIFVYAVIPIFSILLWFYSNGYERRILFIAIFLYYLFNIPFLKFIEKDAAFRLYIVNFIPSGIVLLLGIKRLPNTIILMFSVCIFLYIIPSRNFHNNRTKINYSELEKIVPKIAVPSNALLIAHPGFDYFYHYTTKKEVFRFLPEVEYKEKPIYRIVFGLSYDYVNKKNLYSKDINILNSEYSLMKEESWKKIHNSMPKNMYNSYNNWRNPYLHRPNFLKYRNSI
ncbi:MAG: hypothetical protein L6Q54_01495 [Leptospiraceae bacterium]|nr:hypothetical protein [Leptospiraceae bacterium]MCK6379914.1 hypothetical protein [Leptospiraceae bacterium]NUM40144.1 hypothetical protein [Leptospiraceae bacterium]